MYEPMVALVGLACVFGYLLLTMPDSRSGSRSRWLGCRHRNLSWPHRMGRRGERYRVCLDCSRRVPYSGPLT